MDFNGPDAGKSGDISRLILAWWALPGSGRICSFRDKFDRVPCGAVE
jgi:hypothetical protein